MPALVERADFRRVLWMAGDMGRDSFRKRHTAVELEDPLHIADLGEEALHLLLIGKDCPIEISRVPIEQTLPMSKTTTLAGDVASEIRRRLKKARAIP